MLPRLEGQVGVHAMAMNPPRQRVSSAKPDDIRQLSMAIFESQLVVIDRRPDAGVLLAARALRFLDVGEVRSQNPGDGKRQRPCRSIRDDRADVERRRTHPELRSDIQRSLRQIDVVGVALGRRLFPDLRQLGVHVIECKPVWRE